MTENERKTMMDFAVMQRGEPMDLIDRQDAIRIVDSIDTWQAGWRGNAIESLKAMPPVQPYTDEEIVRCKDCRHSEHWYGDKSRCFLWHEEGIDVFEDGFCNYAERRTDG